ncbi:MAG: DUF6519 domain-containing protein [Candidatus Solibacter sp.]
MKGDFSRFTYDAVNPYSRVLMQQGRVLLDADFNESAEIQVRDLRALARDLIGPHAAPAGPNGEETGAFKIAPRVDAHQAPVKNDFSIGAGHYYVQGILCRNAGAAYREQGGWPDDKAPFDDSKRYLVYLDAWERHITATETDDVLNEPALRGADTCTRAQVVYSVRTLIYEPAGAEDLKADYQAFLNALKLVDAGRLAARVEKPADPDSPCISAPESRYRGENQLYRVEIHTAGAAPTFKWSRENGSEIYPVTDVSGAIVTVRSSGLDDRSTLQPGDVVELVDDAYTLLNRAAPLLRVAAIDSETNQVTVDPAPVTATPPGTHRYLRRWQSAEIDLVAATKAGVNGWIGLEDGLQVKFPDKPEQYDTGQYWTIPARSATGDIIWPQDAGKPAALRPQGTDHAYAPLALITFKPDKTVDKVDDIRRVLTSFWK